MTLGGHVWHEPLAIADLTILAGLSCALAQARAAPVTPRRRADSGEVVLPDEAEVEAG